MEDDRVYNNSIWDECETRVREVLKTNIRDDEQDEDFSGYDRGGWCLWEPRGLLSSDIAPRNRSPPAVVVTVLRGVQGHYNACYAIRRSTGQVCTCPVKPCWVRRGGRSSTDEDDVRCRGRGDERTSRLSIDPSWFTPLIIWVSLSLTLWISPSFFPATIISPGRLPPNDQHPVYLDRAKAQGRFLRAHRWHPAMQAYVTRSPRIL